jgi:glycosyltransferase involved in cell wall biosynthesis
MKILVLEPYYGGSHKTFLDGLQAHLPFDFMLLTLPARKWKWRMRLAAPFYADKIIELFNETKIDAIFSSSFVDVAALRSILPVPVSQLPFYTYFHENQFAYPVRKEDERDFHFGLTNLTTVLASDKVAFSTAYNLQTFLQGVQKIVKVCPDMKLEGIMKKIEAKVSILYPGIDFSQIDKAAQSNRKNSETPVIVWNHRWEHDKNPKYFFNTLFELDANAFDFRLIVLGQSFRRKPQMRDCLPRGISLFQQPNMNSTASQSSRLCGLAVSPCLPTLYPTRNFFPHNIFMKMELCSTNYKKH